MKDNPPLPEKPEKAEEQEDQSSSFSLLSFLPNFITNKSSYLLLGFLMIAGVSGWLNLQQAATVDAFGDVLSVRAEIEEKEIEAAQLRKKSKDPETKPQHQDTARNDLKELNKEIEGLKESVSEELQDVQSSVASMVNGTWFWTIFIQVGAALFGAGIIAIVTNSKEDSRLRAASVLVIGSVVLFLLFSRIINLSVIDDLMRLGM